ncbi:hypothetical protein CBR_g31835 [Chara braunii]|uniref:Cation/H+ exchanger transmembrane domain-containing protein n=1 Tax=Chara braunii TaxID=69332 RepID=A0A388LFS8_CHABU|nr:hypothetical protein CBR_g31835 [Chara braunii]|eukprot:GBG81159.1 hypothetical protein CBR_g31835 [Chara braunii]
MSIVLSRCIHILLRPLKQPMLLSEAASGLLLGPSFFGRVKAFHDLFFPQWSVLTLASVADLGVIFLVFLVGVRVDAAYLRSYGFTMACIAVAGLVLPFGANSIIAFMMHSVLGIKDTKVAAFVILMGITQSVTAFPFLSNILTERKLLGTTLGQIILPAAGLIDIVARWLLSWAIMLLNNVLNVNKVLFALPATIGFVIFMFAVIGPFVRFLSARSKDLDTVPDLWIGLTLVMVLGASLISNLLGMPATFGSFLFGLLLQDGTPLALSVAEKLETLIILSVPLFYVRIGLNFRIDMLDSAAIIAIFVANLIFVTLNKVISCGGIALLLGFGMRRSFVLGILMSSKGLMQLIVIQTCFLAKLINTRVYTMLVLTVLLSDFVVSPIVSRIYSESHRLELDLRFLTKQQINKSGRKDPFLNPSSRLSVLMWFDSGKIAPAMVGLMELCKGSNRSQLQVHVAYLFSLSAPCARPSPLMTVSLAELPTRYFRWRFFPLIYKAFGTPTEIKIHPSLSITIDNDLHWDILAVAAKKHADIVFLPFHNPQSALPGQVGEVRKTNKVILDLLRFSPCNIAISVRPRNQSAGSSMGVDPNAESSTGDFTICVLFFGGPDDRLALALAGRISAHKGTATHVIRFLPQTDTPGADDYFRANEELGSGGSRRLSLSSIWQDTTQQSRGRRPSLQKSMSAYGTELQRDNTALALWCQNKSAKRDSSTGDRESNNNEEQRMPLESQIVRDPLAAAVVAAANKDYDLVIVGRGHTTPSPILAATAYKRPSRTRLTLGKVANALFTAEPKARHIVVVQKGNVNRAAQAIEAAGFSGFAKGFNLASATAPELVSEQDDPIDTLEEMTPEATDLAEAPFLSDMPFFDQGSVAIYAPATGAPGVAADAPATGAGQKAAEQEGMMMFF